MIIRTKVDLMVRGPLLREKGDNASADGKV